MREASRVVIRMRLSLSQRKGAAAVDPDGGGSLNPWVPGPFYE